MSQTGSASKGRRSNLTTLLTRAGPLPTRRTPAVPLRAGRLPSALMLTGRTGRRGNTSGRNHTQSRHTHKRTHRGVIGAAGPGNTTAKVKPTAENKEPTTASCCARGPDRLRNNLARSCKEGVGRGVELPTTAGAGSILDPELPRSREATTASSRTRRPRLECQLLPRDRE